MLDSKLNSFVHAREHAIGMQHAHSIASWKLSNIHTVVLKVWCVPIFGPKKLNFEPNSLAHTSQLKQTTTPNAWERPPMCCRGAIKLLGRPTMGEMCLNWIFFAQMFIWQKKWVLSLIPPPKPLKMVCMIPRHHARQVWWPVDFFLDFVWIP